MILGIDFLRKYQHKYFLGGGRKNSIEKMAPIDLVHSIQDNIQYPISLPRNLTIPPRSVVSVKAVTDLPSPKAKIIYKAM